MCQHLHLQLINVMWDVISNSEQEFSSKRDVHHSVHVCSPDLKKD